MTCPDRSLSALGPALAALALGCLTLTSCRQPPTAIVSVPPHSTPSDQAANDLWTSSLQAASDTPLQAHVVITARDKDSKDRRSVMEMIEGTGGRFRLTYSEPLEARGRVVVCDGKTTWQYEPRSRTVLRRPTPENVSAETGAILLDPLWRREIEPGTQDVSGHSAQVLHVSSADGKVVERLWVDAATGRSLRTESYDRSGGLIRRVELSQIAVKPVVTAATFQPSIPPGARVLTAAAHPSPDAAAEARLLDLPPETAGFQVQSVVRPSQSPTAAVHVLYSNGPRALSVFVTNNGAGGSTELVPADGGESWSSATLTPSLHAFTQERPDGQSAVAWVSDGRRYVAVGRMPLPDLLSVAGALASE